MCGGTPYMWGLAYVSGLKGVLIIKVLVTLPFRVHCRGVVGSTGNSAYNGPVYQDIPVYIYRTT